MPTEANTSPRLKRPAHPRGQNYVHSSSQEGPLKASTISQAFFIVFKKLLAGLEHTNVNRAAKSVFLDSGRII